MGVINGTPGNDALSGTDSADEINGFLGSDSLEGLAGDDTLNGDDQGDTLLGGDGDFDILWGGEGDDSIDGGAGAYDLALYDRAILGVAVDLVTGRSSGADGNDTLVGIERVVGSGFNDTISGGDAANVIWGEAGNDALSGLAGNDRLFGGAGKDSLSGGDGANDWLEGNEGDDSLDGGAGDGDLADYLSAGAAVSVDLFSGTATGGAGNDVLAGIELVRGSGFNDTLTGAASANTLSGDAGHDALYGVGGNDTLIGGTGNDTLDGGAGSADRADYAQATGAVTVDLAAGTASGADGSDVLISIEAVYGSTFKDTLSGDAGANAVFGDAGNDTLRGMAGDDVFSGSAGDDSILGGAGQDRCYFDGDVVDYSIAVSGGVITVTDLAPGTQAYDNDGTDTLREVEVLVFADRIITISDLENDNDIIDLRGPDGGTIAGGTGDDLYIVDDAADDPVELPGEGTDTVRSSVSWTLGANLERLELSGSADIDGTGNSGANLITGTGGANHLDGAAGADTLNGGAGADTYDVDDVSDRVVELSGSDIDSVLSRIGRIELVEFVERGVLVEGSWATEFAGNVLSNTGEGNSAGNLFRGAGGNDSLNGGAGIDAAGYAGNRAGYTVSVNGATVSVTDKNAANGDDGIDVLTGIEALRFADAVVSLNGTAIKRGTTGTQTIDLRATGAQAGAAGPGNDIYLVNARGDAAIERAGGGTDTVKSSVSWTLWENLERLQLTGSAAIDGIGNGAANRLLGNGAANRLVGYAGKDTLDGKVGADTLMGGLGNDTYIVGAGDVLVERVNEGTDTARSKISWTLADQVEQLVLTGTSATNGTGNAGNNTLTGNSAANRLEGLAGNDTLSGGAGVDTMRGGAGNDLYVVSAGDLVEEAAGAGDDTVQSAVTWTLGGNFESLVLTGTGAVDGTGTSIANALSGNAGANRLDAKAGDDVLNGLGGNDTLLGGSGHDTLGGGAGADVFVFESALGATLNKDLVQDFETGSDVLHLDADIFAALVPGALAQAQFLSGDGFDAAQTAEQRIVHDSSTGTLYYDSDGAGGIAAVAFAVLGDTVHPSVTSGDFLIVA